MASGTPGVDELIREYLLFRGFTNTLRAFETDIKNDKDKSFRADRIVDQIQSYVHSFDIVAVRNLWAYLDRRFFSRLEHVYAASVRRLETCLLRYYLIHSVAANRSDRISDFFDRYATELQAQPEWRDWFALPFVRNPEQDKVFSVFFHRTWSESFILSLYNLLSAIFDNMPLPALLQYCEDQRRIHKLSEEVEGLRHELQILHSQQLSADLELQQASVKRAAFTRRHTQPSQQSAESKGATTSANSSVIEYRDAEPAQATTAAAAAAAGAGTATPLARKSSGGMVAKSPVSPVSGTHPPESTRKAAADPSATLQQQQQERQAMNDSPLVIKDNFFQSADRSVPSTPSLASMSSATTDGSSPLASRAQPQATVQHSGSNTNGAASAGSQHSPVAAADASTATTATDGVSMASPPRELPQPSAQSVSQSSVFGSPMSVAAKSAGSVDSTATGSGISAAPAAIDHTTAAAVSPAAAIASGSRSPSVNQVHRSKSDATSARSPQPPPSTQGVFIPGISNIARSATLPGSYRSPGGAATPAGTVADATAAATAGTVPAAAGPVPIAHPLDKSPSAADASTVGKHAVAEENSPFIFLSEEAYSEHRSSVIKCRFAPGGACVASCDIEGVVKVWTSSPCSTLSTVMSSKSPVMTMDWMAAAGNNSSVLLLGYGNGKVRMYDINSKTSTSEFEVSTEYPRVVSLASTYNSMGSLIAAASASAATPASINLEQQVTSLGHQAPVHGAPRHNRLSLTRFFSLGSSGSSGGVDTHNGQLSIWDACNAKMLLSLPLDPAPTCINTLQFNRHGSLLACGSADGMIRIFDVSTGDCIVGWHAHMGQVYSIGFAHDENYLYSLGHDGKFSQWSIRQVAQKMGDILLDTAVIGGLQAAVTTGPLTYSPFNSLFKLDDDGDHILTSNGTQGVIYQLSELSNQSHVQAQKVITLRGHQVPVVGVDWNAALSCGTCLTTAQDGSIYVSTLLKK